MWPVVMCGEYVGEVTLHAPIPIPSFLALHVFAASLTREQLGSLSLRRKL